MTEVKHTYATQEEIKTGQILDGRITLTSDSQRMYWDINGKRLEITDIIELQDEMERVLLQNPLDKFYYIASTGYLWKFHNNIWSVASVGDPEFNISGQDDVKFRLQRELHFEGSQVSQEENGNIIIKTEKSKILDEDNNEFSPKGPIKLIGGEIIEYGDTLIIDVTKNGKRLSNVSIWGAKIDTTDSNPVTSVTFTDDSLLKGVPLNFGEKPCMLKDGVVQYYLNPDNFEQKEDGTPADIISGEDGDVMIEIPKLAYLIKYIGTDLYVKVTNHPDAKRLDPDFCYYGHTKDSEGDLDKIYIGAYLATTIANRLRSLSNAVTSDDITIGQFRTRAKTNGIGYDQISVYPIILLQCMYLVKYGNLNSQLALGKGCVSSSEYLVTGGTNNKGMYYGETTGKLQMKFAGIEDFWGNKFCWVDGYITNASREILTGFKDFNDNGNDYINHGYPSATNISGYCSKAIGNNNCGFITEKSTGSATTYYCDRGDRYDSAMAYFGSNRSSGDSAGIFRLLTSYPGGYSSPSFGSRLMFRSTSGDSL